MTELVPKFTYSTISMGMCIKGCVPIQVVKTVLRLLVLLATVPWPAGLGAAEMFPEVQAVVHAHPPTAIAWTVAKPQLTKLPSDCLSEVILATGDIPFVPYARPGTEDMGKVLLPFLPKHQAMILRNHGALTWGVDLDEAYRGMERIEHSAQILAAAERLGGLVPLPKTEIEYLYELRKKIGDVLL